MEAHPDALYHVLFETTSDGIMIVNDEGRYVDVNESLCRLLKAPRERLVGAHFSEFIPRDLLGSASADFRELKDRGNFAGEFPMQALDGSVVELDWTSRTNFVPGLHFCVARDITARKAADRELQKKQEELEDFVENATLGLHWVGPDGTILWANRAELELLGYTPEEYIGRNIAEFHADPPVIEDILRRLAAKEELHSYEARLRGKDGSIRHVLISSNVRWEDERFLHTRCFTRDITDRKRAEEALRESEARFRTLSTEAPVGIFLTDAEGRCLFVNDCWGQMAGMRPEEALGNGWVRALHPEDRERVAAEWYAAAQSDQEFDLEYRFQRPDGKVTWLRGGATAITGPTGAVIQYVGTVTDITATKEAAEQLRRQAELLEQTSDAIFVWELGGSIRFWNRAAEALYGYPKADVIGQRSHDLLATVHPGGMEAVDARLAQEGRWSGELTHITRDGKQIVVESRQVLVPETDGRRLVLETNRDITERRQAERRTLCEHTITRVLAEATTLEGVAPDFLQAVCDCLGAPVGELWEVDETGTALRCTAAWTRAHSPEIERFQASCQDIRLRCGRGLPGRVWQDREIVVIEDLGTEENFPRLPLAQAAGLRRGLAFPLATGDEFFGVLELFSNQPLALDERVLRMLGAIGHDVAQFVRRRRAEAALAAERERLRVTLTSIGDAVMVTDAAGHPTFLNPVAEALTGWHASEAQGKPLEAVFRIVNEQTGQTAENPVTRVLREGVIVGLANHTVLIARDGTERAIDDSAAPIRDGTGTMTGVVLVFRDVTERRRLEVASRRLAAVVESSDDAIVSKDLNGIVTSWNRGAERIFGYTAEEMVGQPIHRLVPPERPNEEPAILARLRQGESIDHYETVRMRKDGTRLAVSVTISPIRDEEGHIIGASKVGRDISREKTLRDELERRLAELAEADRRKDEFLAMLAHELRNPLGPIRNALHLLHLQAGDVNAVDRYRGMMERQVGHMIRLVDDLLDVSRINRGKISLQRERLDLGRLIQLNVMDHRQALEAAGLSLELRLPSTPVWVLADATRLTQVLDNLLENARKFTERDGTVRVELGTSPATQEALITVTDTGIGIEAEMLPRLFEVFSQADRSLDRSRGGLGLGLALVKGMMELHGGSVAARSAGVGQGAEFRLCLPLEPDPPVFAERRETLTAQRGDLRILIIEDNRDAAESLKDLLETYGYGVSVAYTGAAGVHAAETERPDVVLCDIGLPGMDGFAVAEALRENPDLSGLRLIALTGYGQEADVERTRRAGFDEHLMKPVDVNQLLNRLKAR